MVTPKRLKKEQLFASMIVASSFLQEVAGAGPRQDAETMQRSLRGGLQGVVRQDRAQTDRQTCASHQLAQRAARPK